MCLEELRIHLEVTTFGADEGNISGGVGVGDLVVNLVGRRRVGSVRHDASVSGVFQKDELLVFQSNRLGECDRLKFERRVSGSRSDTSESMGVSLCR